MDHSHTSVPRSRLRRRWITPIIVTGAGITALTVWLEELITFVTEFIGVIFLPVLTAVIYIFNVYVFKSAEPKVDDFKK
jgi:hypothetical protein